MPRLRMFPSMKGALTLIIAALCLAPGTASAAYLTTSRARQASVYAMGHTPAPIGGLLWGDETEAHIYAEGCRRSNAVHVDCVVAGTWANADKDHEDSFGAIRVWVTLSHGVLIVHPAWHGREEDGDVH